MCDGIEVIALDGFSGFKTATTEELPEAATVMDLGGRTTPCFGLALM